MLPARQVSFFNFFSWTGLVVLVLMLAVSCTVPKRYQKDKPFVFKTTIDVKGTLPSSEKAALKENLSNQLDDSLKVRTVLAVRWKPPFLYYRLSAPPVFDTLNMERSKTFMNALLNAQGYFNPLITDTFNIDTVRDQKRATVRFTVIPGKVHRLDSIGYDLTTPELQQLALDNRKNSLLKKNDPYSLQNVSGELDRLLNIYRNHGYYKISKENIYAERDTVIGALIDPSLDPFEQIRLIEELRRRREKPTINVVIKERVPRDSSQLAKYHIGEVKVYPDQSLLDDTAQINYDTATIRGYHFFYTTRRFKLRFIARNISLREGDLYRQDNYFNTLNTFTNLGAWQQVDINLKQRADSLLILDADINLYPAKRYNLNVDFETSRNTGNYVTIGNLFGIGFNVGLRNRNAFRESVQTSTNARFGIELGKDIVQTVQASLSHNIYFSRFILPWRVRDTAVLLPRSLLNLNGTYTIRRNFFTARSINASWGYDWTKKNNVWQVIPFNIEYTAIQKDTSLIRLEKEIPSLRFAFNDGLIIGEIATFSWGRVRGKSRNLIRIKLEESGFLYGFGLMKTFDKSPLRQFVKIDLELKHYIDYAKSTLAFRAFWGNGFAYGKSGTEKETVLPFFKAYFGGGPYSMRAWRIRQLGPGSNLYNDTAKGGPYDRFGDIQLEGNVEYRFNLATISGIKIKSALFVDMGNVWYRKTYNDPNLEGAEFKFSKLYKDLAVAGGTSLRFDFNFFLIRLDWAYKLKNPLYANVKNGWFQNINLGKGQFQLGIGYPF